MIDCHTHLPQYPVVTRGEDQLLPWLRDIIFPTEREFTGDRAQRSGNLLSLTCSQWDQHSGDFHRHPPGGLR